jgi:hypothetical protein
VGFILPARSFPKSPKGKKKTYRGSRRPTAGETQRRARWPASAPCLPSSFSSFLFFLFSLFSFVCTRVCVSCSHVVGSIIFVCIFFSLFEEAACEWWAKKPIFLPPSELKLFPPSKHQNPYHPFSLTSISLP